MFQKEQAIGLFFSIALHVVLVVVVFLSVNPEPIKPPKGLSIQAEIMSLEDLMKNKPKNKKKPVKKKPKPKPVEKKPKPKPKPKPVDKKPVPKPKVDNKKRQEKTERQKKLDEIRRKREELENSTPEPTTTDEQPTEEAPVEEAQPVGSTKGTNQENTQLTQYIASIQSAVTRQWARPASTPKGLTCRIKVSQIPGGGVIDVSIGTPCNANTVVKNSIINAVKKADPLPYRGFEQVFDRRLHFTFQYQGD